MLNSLTVNFPGFSDKFQHMLYNGSEKVHSSRDINKTDKGLYMVMFNKLYIKDEEVLIYNYVKYNPCFGGPLLSYIFECHKGYMRNGMWKDIDLKLFCINKEIIDGINSKWIIDDYNEDNLKVNLENLFFDNLSIVETLYLGNECKPLVKNLEEMKNLLYMTYNKELKYRDLFYTNFIKDIIKKNFITGLSNNKNKHENVLFNVVYIVDDLSSFINKLGFLKINSGPQKWRGQINSLSSTLAVIDEGFRSSMYQYTLNKGYTGLNRSHFSFKNIHMNLGSVRWYSVNKRQG